MECAFCRTNNCSGTTHFAADKAARISSLEASIAALGNSGKPDRERLNVSEFLLNLGVPFLDSEIVSVPTKDEPPDVRFDPAKFEVKELYDDGRRRLDEYNHRLLETQRATQCAELRPLAPYTPKDTTLSEVLELAIAIGAKHSERYAPALVPAIDLLLYHNLVDVMGMDERTFPSTSALAAQGWRSVSVLFGRRSIVFHAAPDAPAWLRIAVGKVTHRK